MLWSNKLIGKKSLTKMIVEKGLSGNEQRAYFDFGTFKVNNKGELVQIKSCTLYLNKINT